MTIPCNTCGHIFDNYYCLRQHLDSDAHYSLNWKCERLCGRAFDTPEALIHHQSVAPLHHALDLYVRWDPDYEEEILCCEDCDREFRNVQSLYQHLRYNSRHHMVDEQLLPYGYGARPTFRDVTESFAQFLEEEQEQQLVQDEHSLPHTVLPIEQESDTTSAPIASPSSIYSSLTSSSKSQSNMLQNLPEPYGNTTSGSDFIVRADPSSPTPSFETNIPDTEPDLLNPAVQNLTLNDQTATSLAKLPFFGPPTLQEELAAMSAMMAVMKLELQAAKDALKRKDLQRQCVMCFERDIDSVTKCGHQFCGVCIDSWQSQYRSPWQTPCPICRKPMGKAIRIYDEPSV